MSWRTCRRRCSIRSPGPPGPAIRRRTATIAGGAKKMAIYPNEMVQLQIDRAIRLDQRRSRANPAPLRVATALDAPSPVHGRVHRVVRRLGRRAEAHMVLG